MNRVTAATISTLALAISAMDASAQQIQTTRQLAQLYDPLDTKLRSNLITQPERSVTSDIVVDCGGCHNIQKGAPPLIIDATPSFQTQKAAPSVARNAAPPRPELQKGNRGPNFETLAKTPGMNAVVLRAALQKSHTNMPVLKLEQQRENAIAYILSLK